MGKNNYCHLKKEVGAEEPEEKPREKKLGVCGPGWPGVRKHVD